MCAYNPMDLYCSKTFSGGLVFHRAFFRRKIYTYKRGENEFEI